MNLPSPPDRYDPKVERSRNLQLTQADGQNFKRGSDVELQGGRIIITSAGGHRFALVVSNAGALSTVAM